MSRNDPLDRRLRDHYASMSAPLPDAVVAAARAEAMTPRPRRGAVLVFAASLAAVLIAAVIIAVGSGPPRVVPTPLPTKVAATATPSLVEVDARFSAGMTLRVTDGGLGDLIEAYPGDRLHVVATTVDGGRTLYHLEGPARSTEEVASRVVVPASLVEANAEPTRDACPPAPGVLSVLEGLRPFERPGCFSLLPLTLRDVWLDTQMGVLSRIPERGAGSIAFAFAPDVPAIASGWATAVGRFGIEDPTCGDAGERLTCRERFMIGRIEPGTSPFTSQAGSWARMRDAPIDGRSSYVALPIDRGLFIWGGDALPGPAEGDLGSTGAIYRRTTDRWTAIRSAPAPRRIEPAAVWTGRQVLIWGGLDLFRDGEQVDGLVRLDDGLAYDPATDTWATIPAAPIDGGSAVGAWTGTELVVVSQAAQAAAWDPAAGTWRRLPDPPLPRGYLEANWTGSELIVLGLGEGARDSIVGAAFEPTEGRWRQIAEVPYDSLVLGIAPVWTGTDMLFVQHAYDPVTDQWRILPTEGCPYGFGIEGVWTGDRVLSQTQSYDPVAGRCQSVPPAPVRPGADELRAHEFHTPAWVDGALIVWSGGSGSDVAYTGADGVAFTPTDR